MKPLSKGKPTKKNKRENIKSYKAKPKFDTKKMNVQFRDLYIWPKVAASNVPTLFFFILSKKIGMQRHHNKDWNSN